MNNAIENVTAALITTAECLGHTLSPAAAEMMAGALAVYPKKQVVQALHDCLHQLQGRLTLAAIVQRIQAHDGHPSANEAWAIALEATDEYKSVALTPQIQQALSVAQPVLSTGDKVGARMAFLSTYERLLTQARQSQQAATWTLSIGFDARARLPALEAATAAGRLTYQPEPLLCLAAPLTDATENQGAQAVLALLAEWKNQEQQQAQETMRQRQRDLEALEQYRAQIKQQWEQKHGKLPAGAGIKANRSKYQKLKKRQANV